MISQVQRLAQTRANEEDILRLQRPLMRQFTLGALRALGQAELSYPQLATIFYLGPEGEATMNELAKALGRSVSATSRLVDGLVQLGFVEREEHPEDRRTKRVRLAEKGERFLDNLERLRSRILNRALDRLSRQERDHVLRGFALMVRAMKATAE